MTTILVSYPSTLAVSVSDAKAHCRIDESADDTLVENLIKVATKYCETYTNTQFINATFKRLMDSWPCNSKVWLKNPPLVSVQSVQYVDQDGNTQTWNSSNYSVINTGNPSAYGFVYSTSAPSYKDQPYSLTVNYTAGYGATAATIPVQALQAIKLLVGNWYENREAIGNVGSEIDFAVHSLLNQIKVESFREDL